MYLLFFSVIIIFIVINYLIIFIIEQSKQTLINQLTSTCKYKLSLHLKLAEQSQCGSTIMLCHF